MIKNPPEQIIPTMKQKRPLNLARMPPQRRLNRVRLLVHTDRKMRLLHVRHAGERRPCAHDHEDGGIPQQEGALEQCPDRLLGERGGGGAHGVDGGLAGEEDGVLGGGLAKGEGGGRERRKERDKKEGESKRQEGKGELQRR